MEKAVVKADLFLIDSSSYFYRAYYAMPPLTNSKGEPTGASLGYTRMLMKLIKEANISYGACLFDSRESLRKQSYEAYKANRKGMPEDLLSQVNSLTDISYLLGFETFRLNGYEADDLIACIVDNFADDFSISICIVSSDKDLKQLLSDRVFIYDALKNKVITKSDFEKEHEIKPDKYRYVLALMGDASDNIPGIKGIGEKTAFGLIKEYGSLNGIYNNIDSLKKLKLKESLLNHKEEAYKSLELASFYKDIKLVDAYFTPHSDKLAVWEGRRKNSLDDFALRKRDDAGLYEIFKRLELNSLLKNFKAAPEDKKYENDDDKGDTDILSIFIDFNDKKKGLFDNEFNLIYIYHKAIGAVSFDLTNIAENTEIVDLLQNDSVCKIGHGLNAIRSFLRDNGIELNNLYFDIKIASYLLNPIKHSHSLADIEGEFEGYLNASGSEYINNKAFLIHGLYRFLKAEIGRDSGLKYLFYNVDMPLSMVLADMEHTGFMVDRNILMPLSASYESDSKKLIGIIHKIAGREFNVSSPKQLSKVMFDEMKFNRIKKNSTDIEVLQALKSRFEMILKDNDDDTLKDYLLFIDCVISYRNKVKLKTSFVDVLLREIGKDGRVHTSFSQTTTSTGRLASQSPNLQNIPVSDNEGSKIRQSFIAKPGFLLLSVDYSQIDLRVMASISGDRALIQSFLNNEDIHAKTASEIFKTTVGEVDQTMRRRAKTINFGIIYGMSSFGLSKELGISVEEAKLYIDLYFKNHSAIKDYMERTVAEAKRDGFVKTAFGRKCYVESINSKVKNSALFPKRAAINAPIQGTAADIIKIAMVNIYNTLKSIPALKEDAKMILQVHDELIFEVKESLKDDLKNMVSKIMTDKNLLKNVPLVVNVGIGKNWTEAH